MVQGGRAARHPLEPAVREGRELLSGEAEEKLAGALERVSRALEGLLREAAGARGLSPIQARILLHLRHRGDGLRRMGELAREFGVAPATVSGAVAALERKGLVRRRSSPGDGRAVALAITPRGGALARELAAWDLPLRRRLAELPSGQKEGALWLLLRLIAGLQEEGAITVSGMCVSCRYFRPHAHPGAARPHHCALLDAPLGVGELRLDCPDHEPAAAG